MKKLASRNSREGKYPLKTSRSGRVKFTRKLIKELKLREMSLGYNGARALKHVHNYLRNHGIK